MNVNIGPYLDAEDLSRQVEIKIDTYDTWSMDHTLGLIALPLLKQLKDTKHGSPLVDLEDLPPELAFTGAAKGEHRQTDLFASPEYDELVWEMVHKKWDWVLDEMIFAFEHICGEDEDWDTGLWKADAVEWTAVGNRVQNGLRLFGKYYRSLWD